MMARLLVRSKCPSGVETGRPAGPDWPEAC